MFSLRNPRLQYLFNSQTNELYKSFLDLKKSVDEKSYKHEVFIAFWLAIEQGKVEEAAKMCDVDENVIHLV